MGNKREKDLSVEASASISRKAASYERESGDIMAIIDRAPGYIKDIILEIEKNGEESYLVGGCVRDHLIGLNPKDYDITTSATPERIMELFRNAEYDWYVDVIPSGIEHGTVSVIARDGGRNESVEITTFRMDGEYLDSRRPKEVIFTNCIKHDLERRDFTVNALAYSHRTGMVDIFGGMDDIKNGIIRCVGNPDERFKEDGLRILRAVRFAVSLGFTIDHRTFACAKSDGYLLGRISKERIRDELTKMLMSNNPSKAIIIMRNMNLISQVMPALETTFDYDQNSKYHRYDLFTHTLKTLEFAHSLSYSLPSETRLVVKLAALLHDVGKPLVMIKDGEGNAHYPGHDMESSEVARSYLKTHRFDNRTCDRVAKLISLHMKIMSSESGLSPRNARKMVAKFTEEELSEEVNLVGALFVLQISDTMAKGVNYDGRVSLIEKFRQMVLDEYEQHGLITENDLAINGRDILALGIERGKEVGMIKRHLLEAVLDDPSRNNRIDLLDIARGFIMDSDKLS